MDQAFGDPQSSSALCPKRDNLGCNATSLLCDQSLRSQYVHFYHKASASTRLGQIVTPPTDRGYLIGASMEAGHERRIFRKGQPSSHRFVQNSIYVRDFETSYKADVTGRFDFVLMELSNTAFHRLQADLDIKTRNRLTDVQAANDPVIGNLLRAMLPIFERPEDYGTLVLDQLSLALAAHLFQRYTEQSQPNVIRASFLSKRQETLAKEMLASHLSGDISITDIAKNCGISPGHFTRAFRATTGHSPHQWLIRQRLEKACALLRDTQLSLAAIAFECGFSEQSHFTRVFSRAFGVPPGRWRREAEF